MSSSWNFSQDIVTSFMGIQPIHPGDRDLHTEGPLLCSMFCSHHLEILNFTFEFLFCKLSPMRQCNTHLNRGDTCNAYRISCHPIHIPYSQCPKSTEFQWAYNAWGFSKTKTSTRQVCYTYLKGICALYFNDNLFWMQKQRSAVLRNKNEQEALPCFPTLTAPCISQHLHWKW